MTRPWWFSEHSLRLVWEEIIPLFVQWAPLTYNLRIDDENDRVGKLKNRIWNDLVQPHLTLISEQLVMNISEDPATVRNTFSKIFDTLFSVCCFLTYDHRMSFERLVGPQSYVVSAIFGITPSVSECFRSTNHYQLKFSSDFGAPLKSGEYLILPHTTWTLQEGAKVLRKFVLTTLQSPIARYEGFATHFEAYYLSLQKVENTLSEPCIDLLSALLDVLLHHYLPRYVQQYPTKEGLQGPVAFDDTKGERSKEKQLNQGNADTLHAVNHPTPVVGFPNVAICECSLAPSADKNPGEPNKDDGITGLSLVEGSLVLNPALLNKAPLISARQVKNDASLSIFNFLLSATSVAVDQEDYVLEPFEEVVRVPRQELFFLGTAEERCLWTQLVTGSNISGEQSSDCQALSSASGRLKDSITDNEARLLLSFVFEAKKQSAIEKLLLFQLSTTMNTEEMLPSTKRMASSRQLIQKIASKEQSTWSLLLARCPTAFPTVPSFWDWSDLAFLYGTNVLDETTAKRARLDSVTAAIESAMFGLDDEVCTPDGDKNEKDDGQLDSIITEFLQKWEKKTNQEEEEAEEKDTATCTSSTSTSASADSDDDTSSSSTSSTCSSTDSNESMQCSEEQKQSNPVKTTRTSQQSRRYLEELARISQAVLRVLFPHFSEYVFNEVLLAPPLSSLSQNIEKITRAELENKLVLQQALLLGYLKPFCPQNFDVVFLARDDPYSNSNHHLPLQTLTLQSQMLSILLLNHLLSEIFSSDNVQWARAVFDSRAFNLNLNGSVQLVLAPVCDMINHSSQWSDILVRRIANNCSAISTVPRDGSQSEGQQGLHKTSDANRDHPREEMKVAYGEGDMIMQLGAGITREQLQAGSSASKELFMSYGPLQNWELLLSYGFTLGDVSPKLPAKGSENHEDAAVTAHNLLQLVSANPYDRLPLPIDLNGLDEGTTALDAAYSRRRQEAIVRHSLNVGNGVWLGGISVASNKSSGETVFTAAVFPAVVGLLRLYHATVEEFPSVEANPFSPCPTAATEAQVWASLTDTLTAVVQVVGSGTVIEEEDAEECKVVESEKDGNESAPDSTSEGSTSSNASNDEEQTNHIDYAELLSNLRKSLQSQLLRVQNLNALIAEANNESQTEESKSAASSAVNERLALLVSIPLRQIAIAGIDLCQQRLEGE